MRYDDRIQNKVINTQNGEVDIKSLFKGIKSNESQMIKKYQTEMKIMKKN